MAWFISNRYPEFETKIAAATSESIPNGDIDFGIALEITDTIRSKQVPPKEAMRLLKKRFVNAENINMQKSAFKLIDFCIKNGGEHFILDIASKEFMDPLINLLKSDDVNDSVKTYILEHIQAWSIMVSTNPKFEYINQTYKRLQNDGFEFPMINEVVDPNMIVSKVAPEWQDSDACMICSKLFTFLNRKHHCRACGGVFCGAHSSNTIELPEFGITIPVRVCDTCYSERKAARKKNSKKHNRKKSDIAKVATDLGTEDEEFKKAIELSLNESAPKSSAVSHQLSVGDIRPTEDDEDEDVKAAIQASLQDLNKETISNDHVREETKSTGLYANLVQEPYSASLTPMQEGSGRNTSSNEPAYLQNPPQHAVGDAFYVSTGIRGEDERVVVNFVDILNKVQSEPPQKRRFDSSLIKMNSDLVLLHPKVGAAIANQLQEIEKYQTLYSKLFAISRLYDDTLQTRFQKEQEILRAQHTRFGAFPLKLQSQMSSQPEVPLQPHRVPLQQQSSLEPQSTYSHQPQVYKLQQYQQNLPPQPQEQQPPASQGQSYQFDLKSPVDGAHEVAPTVTYNVPAQTTGIVGIQGPNLAVLSSLEYAPIPETTGVPVNSEITVSHTGTNGEVKAAPTLKVETKPEPEVVNLIDL